MKNKAKQTDMLKTLIVLAIPTIIEEILTTLLQYVDTAMVGQLGEKATAAVNVTTTISWLVGSMYSAIGVGVLALIAKAIGQNNKELVQTISKQALFLIVIVGSTLGIISMILSPFIPIWMGAEKSIQKEASLYFFIISIPMVFRMASSVLGSALRATKDTKTPLYISFGANVLNVVLNYVFIYLVGFGVIGAAIASAISYVIFGTLMFIAYRRNEYLKWKLKTFKVDKEQLRECMKVSLPVMGTSMTSCMGYVVFAALVSGMGTTIFAAHSIAVTAETIFYIAGYGLRSATSTLVGNSLGENNEEKFHLVSKMSIAVTMVMMCISGIVLFFAAYPLMDLMTSSDEVARLGAQMLKMIAFTEPFFGLMIISEGIFYGLGRTKYTFFVETFSMWGIRILFTSLVVLVWKLDLAAVWYCMIADNICKAILLAIPMMKKGGLWKKQKLQSE